MRTFLPATRWVPLSARLGLVVAAGLSLAIPAAGQAFRCAGASPPATAPRSGSAKPAAAAIPRTAAAIVIFARFADEVVPDRAPEWSQPLLDPDSPGSVAHFYEEMSFGQHRLRGEVAPKRYSAPDGAAAYVADIAGASGQYGRFALEILRQADADIDFSRFDNDGPDGRPDSGDDDGIVDAVFLNVASAPRGFINRDATGVGGLGFDVPFFTDDVGASGSPIRVSPLAGTLQATPDASLAAGVMAHEYGHLLGLIDLYNVDWTNDPSGPERDSAGIGRWGLMGWGADGWEGTPGPNSLSAWSRSRLGWARVAEPATLVQPFDLPPVAADGDLVRVPLSSSEYLLLEYRRRDASHYDRGIPGEGLLIWHVQRARRESSFFWVVDRVCADGRGADAGYPLGTQPAPATGGDNLDFWAHDEAWSAQHTGNLGDATDPFDGVRFTSFTQDTNPASLTTEGVHSVSIEDIGMSAAGATFLVRNRPPTLELTDVAPRADRVAAGAPIPVGFTLANVGGTPARNLRAELTTDDPLLEILDPVIPVIDLNTGASSIGAAVSPDGFPRVRFPADLAEEHTARLDLMILADSLVFARATTTIIGVPSHRVSVTVTDTAGRPLPGVPVTVAGEVDAPYFPLRQITDVEGRAVYHVSRGSYTIGAQPADTSGWSATSQQLIVGDDADLTLALLPVFTLSGRVRLADGSPPTGMYLSVQRISAGDFVGRSVTIEGDGRYSMRIPAGVYDVRTSSYGSSASLTQSLGQVEVFADTQLDLQLPEGIHLTAQVVDESGRPVDDARVQLRSGGSYSFATALTRNGEGADFRVVPGAYTLTLAQLPAPLIDDGASLTVEAVDDTSIRFVVRAGVAVESVLLDSEDVEHRFTGGVTPVGVTFRDTLSQRTFAAQAANGTARFALGLPPGVYQVLVDVWVSFGTTVSQAKFPSQVLGPFEIRADTTLALRLDPGSVVDGYVLGYATGLNRIGTIQLTGPAGTQYTAIREDGSYALRVFPGAYSARVSISGDNRPPSQTVGTITVAGDTTVNWRVEPGERVEGYLRDAAGDGLAGMQVSASSISAAASSSNSSVTGSDGAFAMQLPAGQFALSAYRDRITWRLSTFEVPAISKLDFVLPSGAVVEPLVTDHLGAPAATSLRVHRGTFTLAEFLRQSRAGDYVANAYLDPGISSPIDLAPGVYFVVADGSSSMAAPVVADRVLSTTVSEGPSSLAIELPPPPTGVTLSGDISFAEDPTSQYAVFAAYDAADGVLVRAQVFPGAYSVSLSPGTYEIALYYPTREGIETWIRPGALDLRQDRRLDLAVGPATAIDGADTTPHVFALEQNIPNPFNATTVIRFSLPAAGPAHLDLFDLLGQHVRTLVDREGPPGPQQVQWDGRDAGGRPVASGVYLYQLSTPDRQVTRKLLLLR